MAVVDRSDRFVIAIGGDERLSWLNTISSQDVTSLRDGASGQNLSLDANGRVEHHFALTDLDGTLWIDTDRSGRNRPALVPAEDGVLGQGRTP